MYAMHPGLCRNIWNVCHYWYLMKLLHCMSERASACKTKTHCLQKSFLRTLKDTCLFLVKLANSHLMTACACWGALCASLSQRLLTMCVMHCVNFAERQSNDSFVQIHLWAQPSWVEGRDQSHWCSTPRTSDEEDSHLAQRHLHYG